MMMMMIDHYRVLGLPSGEKGRKLTDREIRKAYKLRALKLHPDKSRFDPNAAVKFQKLKSSYEFLLNEKNCRAFDDLILLRTRRQREEEEARNREIRMKAAAAASRRADEKVDRIFANFEEEAAKFLEEIARFEKSDSLRKMEQTTHHRFDDFTSFKVI